MKYLGDRNVGLDGVPAQPPLAAQLRPVAVGVGAVQLARGQARRILAEHLLGAGQR